MYTVLSLFTITTISAFAQEATINNDTPVKLRLLKEISGGRNKVDEVIPFEVYESIYDSNGNILIPVGAQVVGHITKSTGAGSFGKNATLELSIDSMKAIDNSDIHLSAINKVKNANITAATMIIAPFAGAFSKGLDAVYPEGKLFTAYVSDETQKITISAAKKVNLSIAKPNIVVLTNKWKDLKSMKKMHLEVLVKNNDNTAKSFYLIAKTMKKDMVTNDGSVMIDALMPNEERVCNISFRGNFNPKKDKLAFETFMK